MGVGYKVTQPLTNIKQASVSRQTETGLANIDPINLLIILNVLIDKNLRWMRDKELNALSRL